jgi:hypothetical protein
MLLKVTQYPQPKHQASPVRGARSRERRPTFDRRSRANECPGSRGPGGGAAPWFRLAQPICLQARSASSRHVPTCPLTSAATSRTSTPVQDHPTPLLAPPLGPTPVPEGAPARTTRRCDRQIRAGVPSGPRGAGGRESPASRSPSRRFHCAATGGRPIHASELSAQA